ncbi:MAG: BMP family ABC transporter substrate-binding protein [Chloroflexi bacterium]|nr:BMP family ABC transporter substrate-binding protein [Chloroflexota bacterium]
MKKHFVILTGLLVMAFMVGACATATTDEPAPPPAGDEPAPPPAAEEPTEEPAGCMYKIGFVTDVGQLNDQSFNEAGWNGVLAAVDELGLAEECFGFIETSDSADYIPNIESFISEGFGIIVTSGFAMGAATHQSGIDNPDIFYIGTDQTQTDADFNPEPLDNVAGLIFHEDVSGFLAGALAGLMTESNVVGGVYGCPFIPPVARFEVGYRNGAKYVNPDVEVLNVYHPGSLDVCFTDPEFAAETADTLIAEGADVIFGAGGLTGNGALIAACNKGVKVIGVDVDQYITLPETQDCILSSATKGLTSDVKALIIAATDGTFPGGEVFGPAVLAPFHNFEDVIPQDVKDQLAEISDMIDSGEIDPCAPFEGSNEGTFCTPVTP